MNTFCEVSIEWRVDLAVLEHGRGLVARGRVVAALGRDLGVSVWGQGLSFGIWGASSPPHTGYAWGKPPAREEFTALPKVNFPGQSNVKFPGQSKVNFLIHSP